MATFEELLRLRELELKEEEKEKEFNPFDPGTFGWCGVASGIGGEPGIVGSGMDDVSVRSGVVEDADNPDDGVEPDHKHSYLSLTDTDDTFDDFDNRFPKVDGNKLKFSKIIDSDVPSLLTKKTYRSNKKEAFVLKPYGSATGETGELRFLELSANGINYVGFKAPDSIAANVIWTLPSADGTANYVPKTDGSGILSWTDITGIAGYTAGTTTFVGLTDTPANYTSDAKKLLCVNDAGNAVAFASEVKWDELGNYLGINSASPDSKLTVVDSAFPVIRSTRTSVSDTNTLLGALNLIHKTGGNMIAGLGVAISFSIRDTGMGSANNVASIGAVRADADNTGNLIFKTSKVGSSAERVRMNEEGLLVGGASDVTCGGTACIILQSGTAPTASPNNAPVLFSGPEAVGSSDYCLNIRNEDGTRLRLHQEDFIADPSGAGDAGVDSPCRSVVAGILDILLAEGFMAAS